jgi:hypothetical protein
MTSTKGVTLLVMLVQLLKELLYGFKAPVEPTDEEQERFYAYEDERGIYGMYPSPMEAYRDELEMRERFLSNSVWILLRWRVATMKRPFGRRSAHGFREYLFPKSVVRWIHPQRKLRTY